MTQPGSESFNARRLVHNFGIEGPFDAERGIKVGKAILVVAGADGDLSDKEWSFFLGLARHFGASEGIIDEYLKFDHRGARLEDLLDASTRPAARVILFDAVRTARVDGFHERERASARRAAQVLGLDAGVVSAIESQLALEDGVRNARITLLSSNGPTLPAPAKSLSKDAPHAYGQRFARGRIQYDDFFRDERYGLSGPMPHEFAMNVGKAILTVAGAEGSVSASEMGWFLDMVDALGAPPEAVEQFRRFDYKSAKLENLLTPELRPLARIILFEAMNVARVDGIHDKERQAAVKAARVLGVDASFVSAVEAYFSVEEAVRQARLRVLSPH